MTDYPVYTVDYQFTYPGKQEKEWFSYKIPFEMIVEGIRRYFVKKYDVELDGTDTDIWNMIIDISPKYGDEDEYSELLDDIMDFNEEYFKETLRDDAYEAYKDEYEYYNEDEEEK